MRIRHHSRTSSSGESESGYILLTLMLWVAVISITVTLPMIYYYRQQMIRDREEELVHRGVEYERAVRKYYKKFGSYPANLELLESANHMRFLRKRYKDPITGKDFKLLTQADVMTAFAGGITGGNIAGGQNIGTPVSEMTSAASDSAPAQTTATEAPAPTSGDTSGTTGATDNSAPASGGGSTLPFGAKPTPTSNNGSTLGGGGIVGVASTNKAESIRVYNKKNHYNEWLFAYNPQTDRGGLPKGPYEPSLMTLPGQMGLPGQQGLNGQQGMGQQGFGQQGFGQQGFGQQGFGQQGGMGGAMPGNRR